MGFNPHLGSVQATLDGRILSEEEFAEIEEEMSRVPCDKRCLLALEDVCKCRCGGINHGKWVRGEAHNASLDVFDSEGAPIITNDIARGRLELMLAVKREIAAAYTIALGGRK